MIVSLIADRPSWLVTITHRELHTHPEFSVKARGRWMHSLNKEIFGNHYDRRGEGLLSFFGLEYQKRGTVHQHGVVAGEGLWSVRRSVQQSTLQDVARGFCRLDLPRDPVKAIRYCAKYVAKEGEIDVWLPRSLVVFG